MRNTTLLTFLLLFVAQTFAQTNAPVDFYIVSGYGGQDGLGGIFKSDGQGNDIQLQPFKKYKERSSVYSNPIEPVTGLLYGMTSLGGDYDHGVIWEFDIVSKAYEIRHSFNSTVDGRNPNGSLFKAANGKLYGMTKNGGANDKGVIFEYDLSAHAVVKLFDFGAANGEEPKGSLIQATDGKLYGMTSKGGSAGTGVIFRYDIASGTFEKLLDFTGANGSTPQGDLFQASNGLMYGFTQYGGTSNYGVMFSIDPATLAYVNIMNMTSTSRYPAGSFIQSTTDGKLYGLARNLLLKYTLSTGTMQTITAAFTLDGTPFQNALGEMLLFSRSATGNMYQTGAICKYTSNVSVLSYFASGIGQLNDGSGKVPCNSMLLASDGLLYGITAQNSDYHGGALFSYQGYGSATTPRVMFSVQSQVGSSTSDLAQVDRKLYGIGSGGKYNSGTIYRYDIDTDSIEVMVDLNTLPMYPGMNTFNCSFVLHPNGKLYAPFHGGANFAGFIMEYVPGASTFTNVYSFPANPNSAVSTNVRLTVGEDGFIYGVGNHGGTYNYGTLFRFDVSTGAITILHNFDYWDKFPYKLEVTQASNGKLYGITPGDVNDAYGKIYSYDLTTDTFEEIYTTAGLHYPMGPFVEGPDGSLYASFRSGDILRLDPVTETVEMIFEFENGVTGTNPSKVVMGTNGKLYGLSDIYSLRFFEIDPLTLTYTLKYDFNNSTELSIANFYGFTKVCRDIFVTSTLDTATVCPADNFEYTATATGDSLSFQWMKGLTVLAGQTDTTLSIANVSQADSGLYYCVVSNGCREVYSDSVVLVVPTPPVVNAGADQYICSDSLTVLSASGNALTYTWNNGVINEQPFAVTADAQYVVTGTDAFGCTSTDTVEVLLTPVVHAGPDTTVCMMSSIVLQASGDAVSYVWNDTIADGTSFLITETQTFVVTGLNAEGCPRRDTLVVTASALPVVDAGTDTTLCAVSSIVLQGSGDAVSYIWNDTIADGSSFLVTESQALVLTGVSAEGCTATDSLLVTASALPVVDAGTDTTLCAVASIVLQGSGDAVSYVWNDTIADGTSFLVTESQALVVTGVNAEGCTATDTLVVNVSVLPAVDAGTDTALCTMSSIVLQGSGDAVSYVWNDTIADGTSFLVTETQTLVVTGVNADGCAATDTLVVTALALPVVDAGTDTTVCMLSSVVLEASGDAVSYVWNDTIADGSPFLVTETQTLVVTGVNAEGCTATDTLTLLLDSCQIVWPGDTDGDAQVGIQDFFNVGLHYGQTGEPRAVVSNAWEQQPAPYWDSIMSIGTGIGLNMAHVDCNGDGSVDANDTLAIHQNFAMFHLKSGNERSMLDGGIYFSSTSDVYGPNELVTVDIYAGSSQLSLEDIYGLGFDVAYEATGIVPGSLRIRMNDQSWIGDVAVDAMRLGVEDNAQNTAHLALCRTDHTNVSGYGIVGQVTFMTSDVPGEVELFASNGMAVAADGMLADLSTADYAVTVDPALAVSENAPALSCRVFPNPSKGTFHISGLRAEASYTIVLRDLTGMTLQVMKSANQATAKIEADLPAGSYVIEITDGSAVYRERIVVAGN